MRRWALGVALCAAIAGCDKAEDGLETKIGAYSLFDPVAANPSLCGGPAIPFPNNALFADSASPTGITTDTTLNIPSTASTAVAANLTDGYSTTASIFTDVLGLVDYSTAANAIVIVEADATPRILQPGVDYTVQPSIAMAQFSGTGGCAINAGVNTLPAVFLPISQQRSRLLIEPLKPLAASTTYIVAVTKDLLSSHGVPTTTNEFFPIANSDTKICKLSGAESGSELLCTDPGAPAETAARIAPVLDTLTAPLPTSGGVISGAAAAAARLTTLEALRRNLVRPTVSAFKSFQNTLADPDLTDDDLVIAWSFTTQTIGASLQTLDAVLTSKTFAVANSGLSTGDLDLDGDAVPGDLPDTADIFVGTLNSVPYYLDDAATVNDTGPLTGFWRNDGTVTMGASGVWPAVVFDHDANPATPPIPAPCSGAPFNFVRPLSITNCYRIPVAGGNDATGNPWGSLENLPVMVTVPNANSGQTKPTNGWPVAIFQHGITGNRTQMLAIAPALATAGFVTVAIDLPLHGLVPATATATCGSTSNNAFYIPGGVERTFDLDLVNNTTGAAGPDGVTDCSGTHFINLSSLITSRDNLRQAVADLTHVVRSLQAADPMNLDAMAGDDIDETRIHFAGISLGGIVGTTLLGVDAGGVIKASSLSVPGGGVAKLLDASATFGPRIAAGLASVAFSTDLAGTASPFEGTDTYETFVRFAQHLTDPGDPINFAVAANANHRIHMAEVIGDTVVPNSALTNCPAANQLAPGIGGTPAADNTNAATRQAACAAGAALIGANAVTGAPTNACPGIPATGVCTASAGQDETLISGFMSGTEPLFGEMGLDVIGPITPPTDCANDTDVGGLDVVVQFAIGTHGSLLTPAGPNGATEFLDVTTEMQRQTATFLASNGVTLASGGCP